MQEVGITAESFRALIQQQSVTMSTRVVAFVAAAVLFVAVAEAVRRRRIKEEFTPVWLTAAFSSSYCLFGSTC